MTNFTPQTSPAQELRELLGAIHHTLAIDPPASAAADDAYRRAFAHRAVLVHVAVDNLLRDPGAYPAAMSAAWLREQTAKLSARPGWGRCGPGGRPRSR